MRICEPEPMSGNTDRTRRSRQPILLAMLGFICVTTQAGAQQPSQAQISAIRASCQADYRAHCAGVPTGGKPALNCLQKNLETLSSACQTAVNAVGGGAASAPPPAQASPAPAPPLPAPSGAATEPAPEPSAVPPAAAPPPRSYPPMSPRQELALLRQSCGADYRAFCADVQPGGGRVIACLRDNGPSLSPRCRSALMGARRR
jgi:Cysteine rich repeat